MPLSIHPAARHAGWLLLALWLAGCSSTAETLPLAPCQLRAEGLPLRKEARCGTVSLPENPADPTGRRIDLHVAVVPATGGNRVDDPLFFLTGGPGQAATESFVVMGDAFIIANQRRDIVLVDQRGTGQSHPLRCERLEESEAFETLDEAAQAAEIQACLDELDADPRFYTTLAAVDDLEAVRAALGYPTINLYGISYGTRVAQSYLARYPQRVRSVILDGIVPPTEALGLEVARDAQRALDGIFARCEAEAGCSAAFPALRTEWQTVLARVEAEPVMVQVADPRTGLDSELRFTREQLVGTVRLHSYSAETAALLPLLIHRAAGGDLAPLAAQSLMLTEQLGQSMNPLLGWSVLCTEDEPFLKESETAAANADTYLGSIQTDALHRVCAEWPRNELPAGAKAPLRSDHPVLLLSGEADPVTPPSNGDEVGAGLPNSLHLVVPGHGHNVAPRGCIPILMTQFLERASVEGLDTTCVQAITPPPFFVNLSGPQP